jgi:C-terminal processing protease CtpA/Prc
VDAPTECSVDSQNKFVYDVLRDSYLWADEVPDANVSQSYYSSAEDVLKAFRSPHDSFSFIISAKEEQSYFEEGKNDNFGFDLSVVDTNSSSSAYAILINFVYPDSPAQKAGIKRGELITKVNDLNISEENFNTIVKAFEKESSVKLTLFQKGAKTEKTVQKATYNINPILYHDILTYNNHRIGYMVFQDFIDTAIPLVDDVFTSFKKAEVDELILDLRYNGGGSDKIANHLASLIGGSNVASKVFHTVSFNQRYAGYNYKQYFEKMHPNALNLKRVFVITTERTCSASELVINGLRASANNIQVIQIGSATCGKPYGYAQSGIFCDKALFAIDMSTKNSDGVGDYVDGLVPTCQIDDGYFYDFADANESMLQETLYYISHSSCSSSKGVRSVASLKTEVFKFPKTGFKRMMSAY